MALKLLRKEWTLCLHPAALIMLGLSTLTLIPNYPYTVSFFYTTLGLFFIAQGARENHDVTFTLTLPVDKKAVVDGRFLLAEKDITLLYRGSRNQRILALHPDQKTEDALQEIDRIARGDSHGDARWK